MLPEYNISLAHNALLIISMWSEAREAVCQGLPVSGRAGGPGPSPLAAVLRHLRYPHHLSRVPTSLCSHSRLVSKRSHKWQLWVRWWLRDSWFSCPVGATQTGKLVPAKPGAGLGLGVAWFLLLLSPAAQQWLPPTRASVLVRGRPSRPGLRSCPHPDGHYWCGQPYSLLPIQWQPPWSTSSQSAQHQPNGAEGQCQEQG